MQAGVTAIATTDDVNSTLQNIARQIGQWVTAFNGRFVLGSTTLSNATTTVVTQNGVQANSFISLTPTNAAAGLAQRTNGLFISATVAGASFSISTQSGQAAGTETLTYIIWNPS